MVNLFFRKAYTVCPLEKIKFFNFKIIEFEKILIIKTLFLPILGIETFDPVGPISGLESILDFFHKVA